METIPLFPLNSVLFPKGRISLQIFESRYVDMIRNSLKTQSGFGIVLINSGTEVAKTGQKLDIHRTGTYCEVVDWNQLPNGLLGITAEGRSTFRVIESWRGVRPTMHYSQSREDYLVGHATYAQPDMIALKDMGYKKQKLRAHSDFYWNTATNDWVLGYLPTHDIMCESKAKNLSSFALYEMSKQIQV